MMTTRQQQQQQQRRQQQRRTSLFGSFFSLSLSSSSSSFFSSSYSKTTRRVTAVLLILPLILICSLLIQRKSLTLSTITKTTTTTTNYTMITTTPVIWNSSGSTEPTDITIKIPYPVILASLYKSGTTSIHEYFLCGKQRSRHYRTGGCMKRNMEESSTKPLLEGCGGKNNYNADIYTDNNWEVCWDPSVYALDELYRFYPYMTLMLVVRDSYSWISSVSRYKNVLRLALNCTNLWPTQQTDLYNDNGRTNLTKDDIRLYYLWQINHVRQFASTHPSITYIEVSLESNDTASILEDRIGIPASCWGNNNQNTHHKEKHPELLLHD